MTANAFTTVLLDRTHALSHRAKCHTNPDSQRDLSERRMSMTDSAKYHTDYDSGRMSSISTTCAVMHLHVFIMIETPLDNVIGPCDLWYLAWCTWKGTPAAQVPYAISKIDGIVYTCIIGSRWAVLVGLKPKRLFFGYLNAWLVNSAPITPIQIVKSTAEYLQNADYY